MERGGQEGTEGSVKEQGDDPGGVGESDGGRSERTIHEYQQGQHGVGQLPEDPERVGL